jgi:SAM-dependent methyltransferase
MELVNPKSVLDIGCGTGTWLKIFGDLGVNDYLGVDGDYVDRSLLKIPHDKFYPYDLSKKLNLGRKFDLIVSLEVAEHLPKSAADLFVDTLVTHGDVILFSAAIPGQGGQNHLNEQWQEYWKLKFQRHDFHFHDIVRPIIWSNQKVEWWYKQNIFLVKKGIVSNPPMLNLVHPILLDEKTAANTLYIDNLLNGKEGIRMASKIFINSIFFKIKNLLTKNKS